MTAKLKKMAEGFGLCGDRIDKLTTKYERNECKNTPKILDRCYMIYSRVKERKQESRKAIATPTGIFV